MIFKKSSDYTLFIERRQRFFQAIQDRYGWQGPAMLLLCGDFEEPRHLFRQDSSFYYLTGITEPASVALCYFDGESTLYVPRFGERRDKWVTTSLHAGIDPKKIGFSEVRNLGAPEKAYFFRPLLIADQYVTLIDDIRLFIASGGQVFTISPKNKMNSGLERMFFERMNTWVPGLKDRIADATWAIDFLRRSKDEYEISLIHQAVQVTSLAQVAAAHSIAPGRFEYEIQAMVDYMFSSVAGAQPAFPSIVAAGKNATVLHYTDRTSELQDGQMVVVDIGAEYGFYAADLTRTYPVNGRFSDRQRELYAIVLETQKYLESVAQPGMYLRNEEHPDVSLHHLCIKCLEHYGLSPYFTHGVGHYLGLDVHDVGSNADPLMPGDVFTLEPGVYLPDEACGIRIEDNYVMVEDGVVCLSAELAKEPDEIEALMAEEQ